MSSNEDPQTARHFGAVRPRLRIDSSGARLAVVDATTEAGKISSAVVRGATEASLETAARGAPSLGGVA